MPYFASEENSPPVLTQSSHLTTITTPAPASAATAATAFGKPAASKTSSRPAGGPLASVDSNINTVNGTRPIRCSPPPPSSPPPSPPRSIIDDPLLYYKQRHHSHHTVSRSDDGDGDDMSSNASSGNMTGRSGTDSGSSTGGAASSHTTTGTRDEDLRPGGSAPESSLYQKENDRNAIDGINGTGRRPPFHSSASSPAIPQRAPPQPPLKPPSTSQSASQMPPMQLHSRPEALSLPPPPPPKPTSASQRTKSPGQGGPISVPNPMADRTRVGIPPAHGQTHLSPSLQQHQQPPFWGNGTSTEESEQTDTSPDDAQARYSMASTSASSIIHTPADMYSARQGNKNDAATLPNGTPSLTTIPSGSPVTGFSTFGPAATAPATASTTAATTPTTAAAPPTVPGAVTTTSPESMSPSHFSTQSLNPQQLQHGQSPVAPHRFSSPPAYNPAAASTAAGLKQRHTLEVPKHSPARNSREGLDAAGVFASGRFSPTAAGGAGSGTGSIGGRRASLSLVRRNTRSLHSELPRDEVVPDEDALRWAEAYRQKRASKKRRMEQDDDQVLVGTKVDENHTNWVAAYNMLTGIRVSVSRTNAKLDRPLTDEDFEAKQKSTFDIAGNELVPSAKYDFKFKDYAPWVFRHLRALFHLDPADYLMSLAGKYILSELGSPGKSGSFFYFSRDYKYIIKTIHHSEHKFLRKILKDYYKHVTENPNTLLSQFFGLHRVKMPYGRKIHFVVMNNLFPPHRDIHQTFDLKGSTIGRDYPEELLSKNPRATMKDLNWLRRHQHLELGIIKKRLFLEQLHKDVALLQRLEIMDYSLLVGTHDLHRGNDENLRGKILQVFEPGGDNNPESADPQSVLMRTPSKLEHQRKTRELRQMLRSERPVPIGESSNGMPDELDESKQSIFYKDDGGFQATHQNNTPANEIYYLGVIDCLTHYGVVKKIEHFWKGLSHDRAEISALPPQQYGERFLKFVSGITMSPEEAARETSERAEVAAAEAAAATAQANAPMVADGDTGEGSSAAVVTGREKEKQKDTVHGHGSWSSNLRHRSGHSQRSSDGAVSPAAAHRAAENEALKLSPPNEEEMTKTTVPTDNGILLPSVVVGSGSSPPLMSSSPNAAHGERRESLQQSVLPPVEEAGEASSTGGQSQRSRFSNHTAECDGRPLTPAKDGVETDPRFGDPNLHQSGSRKAGGGSPPTPPTSSYLKPESADSGYGVSGTRSRSGTVGSGPKIKMQLSRESLDKALPPLPKLDGAA